MKRNPLLDLEAVSQSIRMDDIRHGTISSGGLQQLNQSGGFSGLTSTPSISESHSYNESVGTRRLPSLVDRTNAMIKVLATPEDSPAIQQLTAEGINVNFSLLFGLPGYREGTDAYNTLPIETLTPPPDHEHPEQSPDQNVSDADQVLKDLSFVGIDLDAATEPLEDEGVAKFSEAFEQLMAALHKEWAATFQAPVNP